MLRPRNAAVHWLLAGLLASIAAWVLANAFSEAARGTAWGAGGPAALLAGCPLPSLPADDGVPLPRRAFEKSPALCVALCVPFALFALLIASDSWHHLVFAAAPSPSSRVRVGRPGVLGLRDLELRLPGAGLGVLLHRAARSAPRADRWRAALVVAATLLPLVAHTATLLAWLPLDFPVTPGALGPDGAPRRRRRSTGSRSSTRSPSCSATWSSSSTTASSWPTPAAW